VTSNSLVRRLGPLLVAFGLAVIGALLLVGQREETSTPPTAAVVSAGVPTLVASVDVPAGTPVSDLTASVEVRDLPAAARAAGAVEALAGLPPGRLLAPLVPGQQVLTSAIGNDPRDAVGTDLVAISAVLAPERWLGPVKTTGDEVKVYAVGGDEAVAITTAIVLSAPDPATVVLGQSVLLTLGVPNADAGRVIGALSGAGIWLASP
jgi:pilus assembly protein CpaB